MKIFLIGYRCTGKTTIGEILARRLNFNFIDTDRLIEEKIGSSILKFIETYGWDKFRAIESDILFNTKPVVHTVIATGGGIILNQENRKFIIKNGFSIWLDADIETILFRLNTDINTQTSRPSLTNKDLIKETNEIVMKRQPLYEKTAQMRIDTSCQPPEEIVNIIDRRLKDVRQ